MTDRYAVFGNPIEQSKSPQIHAAFAEQARQDLVYHRQAVAVGGFAAAADEFFAAGGRGLNITLPFKREACAYADRLSDRASLAGAVNTLMKNADGSILGDNTDGVGLVADITRRLGWTIAGANVMLLGAGGAVRGVIYPLLLQNPGSLAIANRTLAKAEELAAIFAPYGDVSAREYTRPHDGVFDLIINGTSASLAGDIPPLNTKCVQRGTRVYDMVYGKQPTAFLRWAASLGATELSDGLGMLVGQAAESFRLWRGVEVDTEPVLAMLRAA